MSDQGVLYCELSQALDQVPERKNGERLVIIVGGTAHMSSGMRELLFASLAKRDADAVRVEPAELKTKCVVALYERRLQELDRAGLHLNRVGQGKGERKRNKRHRYCSWLP